MTNETLRDIDYLAQKCIDKYNIKIPINDIDDVVSSLGGRIEDMLIENLSDGYLQKIGSEHFVIFASPYRDKINRRFHIAQELGHLFMHMGFKTNEELWESQKSGVWYSDSVECEEEATEFASALLMPKNVYNEILKRYTVGNEVKTAKIADYFGVSVSLASARGKALGYLHDTGINERKN